MGELLLYHKGSKICETNYRKVTLVRHHQSVSKYECNNILLLLNELIIANCTSTNRNCGKKTYPNPYKVIFFRLVKSCRHNGYRSIQKCTLMVLYGSLSINSTVYKRSFVHLFIHSSIRSFVHLFINSYIHSFIQPANHSLYPINGYGYMHKEF